MIQASIKVMWVGAVLATLTLVLKHYYSSQSCVLEVVIATFYTLCLVGEACYEVNVIPFGAEQLKDAPNESVSSFIFWMKWSEIVHYTLQSSIIYVMNYFPNIFREDEKRMTLSLLPLIGLSITVMLEQNLKHWFTVEPIGRNPLKNISGVIRYVVKNKYPRARSAFTYTGQEQPSRFDFAKTRYGGPFSTAEVEDVKTFGRILLVCLSMFGVYTAQSAIQESLYSIILRLKTLSLSKLQYSYFMNSSIVITLLAGMFEIALYPFISRWIPSILKRIGIGILLQALSLSIQTCLIVEIDKLKNDNLNVNHLWPYVYFPVVLYVVSELILFTASFEFICAQAPKSMRRLFIGLFYCKNGLLYLINAILQLSLTSNITGGGMYPGPSDEFRLWYYVLNLSISVVGFVMFCFAAFLYRRRERQDLSFQQSVVENVYDNEVEIQPTDVTPLI